MAGNSKVFSYAYLGAKSRIITDDITGETGYQIKLLNRTGGASVKGYVACAHSTIDYAIELSGINDPDPTYIIAESGIADGSEVWCWKIGMANCLVYCNANAGDGGNPTRHWLVRTPATCDTITTTGHATSEPLPSAPFASDKHFQELGHTCASRTGSGLVLVSTHAN